MATGKVINAANSSFSLSAGFRDIFSCCFGNTSSSSSGGGGGVVGGVSSDNTAKDRQVVGETKKSGGSDWVGGDDLIVRKKGGGETGGWGKIGEKKEGVVLHFHDSSDSDVGDEFRDSAIDSASLTSQLNARDSAEGDTMRTGAQLDPEELASNDFDHPDNHDPASVGPGPVSIGVAEEPPFIEGNTRIDSDTREADPRTQENGDAALAAAAAAATDAADDQITEESQELDSDNSRDATAGQPTIHCGRIRMTVDHDPTHHRLSVTIHEADDIPERDRVNLSHSEVHLLMTLGSSSKKSRHKTKAKTGDQPRFEETFRFKLPSDDDMSSGGLRMRLYRSEKFKKERMIGETFLSLQSILTQNKTNPPSSTWVNLEPRFNLVSISPDDDQNTGTAKIAAQSSMTAGPAAELMLSLAYNATTGRLSVEVVQGCNFKSSNSQKPPDTEVKLRLLAANGREMGRSKTATRRSQPSPIFKETFMYHIPQSQLPDVSLMVSVCEPRSLKHSQLLGWFTIGHTNSTEDTRRHWEAMIDSRGEPTSRWHCLLNP